MNQNLTDRKPGLKAVRKAVLPPVVFCFFLVAGGTAGCGSQNEPVFSVQEEMIPETESQKETLTAGDAAEKEADSEEKTPEEQSVLYVYVTGAVENPGVYVLPEGSRISDAAAAAGGLTREADPTRVNQAAAVKDGMMIRFPTKEETASYQTDSSGPVSSVTDPRFVTEGAAAGNSADISGGKININTADLETLMTLNGIGKTKAEAVIAYREEHGGFRSIEEICEVNGIKDSVFAGIRESITVD